MIVLQREVDFSQSISQNMVDFCRFNEFIIDVYAEWLNTMSVLNAAESRLEIVWNRPVLSFIVYGRRRFWVD